MIEHHPDPAAFLSSVPSEHMIIKVPTARGPLAWASRIAARLRISSPLDALFLVDDASPHTVLFTRRGAAALVERSGWLVVRRFSVTEVAGELPSRLRLATDVPVALRWPIAVVGIVIGRLGRWWSDTEVLLAVRVESSNG